MNWTKWMSWAFLALGIAGCAAPRQASIALDKDYHAGRSDKIGVVMSELPAPDTAFPGADCLLCIGVASAANSSLTSAVKSWPVDDLKGLPAELAGVLRAKQQQVVEAGAPLKIASLPDRKAEPGFARKDFSSLRSTMGVDRLLVVNVVSLGAWRNYASYVPTGAPRAVFKTQAYIVNLANHKYDWYEEFDLSRNAEGAWDEPPKFPGMTNAYFQVIETGKDRIKRALAP